MRRSLTTLTLLLACGAAWAAGESSLFPPPEPHVRAAWRESLRREAQGDYAAALAALGAAPRDYATLLRCAWLEYLAGAYAASVKHYQAALRRAPESLEARLGLLLPLLALERCDEAERVAREVLQETPRNPLALARLAVAQRQQGRLKAAEETLRQALSWHPANVVLLTEMGWLRAAQSRRLEARRSLAEVLRLDPDNAVAQAQLADPAGPLRPPSRPLAGAAAYVGGIDYEGTLLKSRAWITGVRGWARPHRHHLIEGGVDYLDIIYQGTPHLRQLDATVAYANSSLPRFNLRAGGHYTASDDPLTDAGWVAFGGVDWFADTGWDLGLEGCFSRYANHSPALSVFQLRPRIGVQLAGGEAWTLRGELAGYWIRLESPVPGVPHRDLFSGEGRLTWSWGDWRLAGFGWAGEQAFAVRNNGYTVFNLAEQHTAGYGAEIRRAFGPHLGLGVRYQREDFLEILTGVDAAQHIFLATIDLTF